MKIAFMFPGQGAQIIGMGKDVYDKYDEARKIYERASDVLGIVLLKGVDVSELKEKFKKL